MFEFFRRKLSPDPVADAPIQVDKATEIFVQPSVKTPELILPPAFVQLKPLKWVETLDGKVGIVWKIGLDLMAEVHIVNDIGETIATEQYSCQLLKLARYAKIPECRRPASPAYAATLGYV
jgi:hypothetical protein